MEWSSSVWSSDLLSYWTWSGVVELPSFRHFVKLGVTRDNMAGIWTEDCSEPSIYTVYTNSLDLLSELNGLVGHPVGVWRNCMLFLETPQMWSQGSPDSVSLCFGSSDESWGQGSNESRTLHPEALSIYPYVQSSWFNRIAYQVGFEREVSCLDPITLMACVLRRHL